MKHSIIPLFIPHSGCPHQCVFCNQVRITGRTTPVTPEEVRNKINLYTTGPGEQKQWEAAFYGGTFTALPPHLIKALLKPASEAMREGRITAIRISTRPDAIDEQILQILLDGGVRTVELGVQSMDQEVLKKSERGHTAEQVCLAVQQLKKAGLSVGLQFMVGLPGEDGASLRRTARRGVRLHPDFIRIYPVLVLEGTALADSWRQGQYSPCTLESALCACAFLKKYYGRHSIPVIRTGLQATEELDRGGSFLAGPYHPAMGELTDQYLFRHAVNHTWKNMKGSPKNIMCHPRDRSKIMGFRGKNWKEWQTRFGGRLQCREEASIQPGMIILKTDQEKKEIFPESEIYCYSR
ncbi:MAG TPA: radical SAM protein [Veillonellaceae bacterium]|nr:radical SAM protein [Veillonellaceae bacterium]